MPWPRDSLLFFKESHIYYWMKFYSNPKAGNAFPKSL